MLSLGRRLWPVVFEDFSELVVFKFISEKVVFQSGFVSFGRWLVGKYVGNYS